MTVNEVKQIVQSYLPFDTGHMYTQGTQFQEDTNSITVIYKVDAVPYIWYQEKGFTHYISGKFIDVNKYFIQNDTTNALDFLANTADTSERSIINATNKRTIQARDSLISQGLVDSEIGEINDYIG